MTYSVIADDGAKPIKLWTQGVPVEDAALGQLKNLARLPFIHSHVAVMPDVHHGKGATVGSVIPTHGAIIPAAVGVDIGCGMMWARTDLKAEDLPDNLAAVRSEIEARIPVGFAIHQHPPMENRFVWNSLCTNYDREKARLWDKYPKLRPAFERAPQQVGTLGGGNHFVEIVIDDEGYVGIMVHSGSRGLGNQIGQRFIELAKEDMRRWFINLPDQDLAYIPEGSEFFDDYRAGLHFAQQYARGNRAVMMGAAMEALAKHTRPFKPTDHAVNCHHNYVAEERWGGKTVYVTRKGAVSAKLDELGIIPGSMGAKSFIVRGKGNRESFCSCSHGAGRVMSRTEAKKRFTLEDHAKAVAGIECRKDSDVLDETPGAYKDIDAVMAAQADLIEVVRTLRQVVCVKG